MLTIKKKKKKKENIPKFVNSGETKFVRKQLYSLNRNKREEMKVERNMCEMKRKKGSEGGRGTSRRRKSITTNGTVKQPKDTYYCLELEGRSSTRNATSQLMIGSRSANGSVNYGATRMEVAA